MKKFKILYFLPAILLILFFVMDFVRSGRFEYFFNLTLWFNVLFMVAVGIVMCKGKAVGAYLGIAYGVLWIVYDVVYHKMNGYSREVPLEILCIPLIIYYIYCLIAINTANTGACDTKDTLIKSFHDKMDVLQSRFWADK